MNEPTSVQEIEKIEQQSMSFEEQVARMFMALTEEELQSIKQNNPQRSMPQIILVIAIKIGNLEIVEWISDNYPDVLNKTITTDTFAVLHRLGIDINLS
tara:strand:+ start:210 stop:506 length:297 start_codon:yes stop_codon:yes gene_type:complete